MTTCFHLHQHQNQLFSFIKCELLIYIRTSKFYIFNWRNLFERDSFLIGGFCASIVWFVIYICLLTFRKGDHYRYLAETKVGNDRKEARDQSLMAYEVGLLSYFLLCKKRSQLKSVGWNNFLCCRLVLVLLHQIFPLLIKLDLGWL